jgi:hypothetical protein
LNGLTGALKVVGDNMDTLVASAQALFKLFIAARFAGLVQGFFAWSNATKVATVDTVAATVEVGKQTVALGLNTAATGLNTKAKADNAIANRALAGQLTGLAANIAGVGGAAGKAADGIKTAGTSTGVLARGFGLLGGAARLATGLLGGWIGALATLILFGPQIKTFVDNALVDFGRFLRGQQSLKDATREVEEAQKADLIASEELRESRERQRLAAERAALAQFNLTKSGAALIKNLEELKSQGKLTSDEIEKIGKDFDLSTIPGVQNAGSVLDALLQRGVITSEQFKAAWATALDGKDLALFGFQAQEAFDSAGRGVEQLAAAFEARLSAAIDRTGVDITTFEDRMGAASVSAVNDVDTLISGLDRLKAQGLDAAAVLEASLVKGLDTADSQAAVEQLRARIEEVRNVLGTTVANGLLEQANLKAQELRQKMEDLKPGINSVGEAMRVLGVTTQASLDGTAKKAGDAYRVIRDSGTATASELRQAFTAYAEAAIKANGGVATETLKVEAALRGVVIAADSAGKAIITNMNSASDATKAAAAELKRLQDMSSQNGPKGGTPYYDSNGVLRKPGGGSSGGGAEAYTNPLGGDGSMPDTFDPRQATRDRLSSNNVFRASVPVPVANEATRGTAVNINLNGSRTRVNVTSQADAAALESVLRQLADQSTRALI